MLELVTDYREPAAHTLSLCTTFMKRRFCASTCVLLVLCSHQSILHRFLSYFAVCQNCGVRHLEQSSGIFSNRYDRVFRCPFMPTESPRAGRTFRFAALLVFSFRGSLTKIQRCYLISTGRDD